MRLSPASRPPRPGSLALLGERASVADESRPAVTIVVTTKNNEATLADCLRSIRAQSVPCTLIVVDNGSTDATWSISEQYADQVIKAGPERSRQRNVGARTASAGIIGFIDSDMVLEADVIAQAVAVIADGAGAVVVPERTEGFGFWARVRQFERAFYVGAPNVEAARFFRSDVLVATGGFDESLTGAEDWDLTIRSRAFTEVRRVEGWILHREGRVSFMSVCRKKAQYAVGVSRFVAKHGGQVIAGAADRPYLRNPLRLVFPHPALGVGLVALKTGEAVAMLGALGRHGLRRLRA